MGEYQSHLGPVLIGVSLNTYFYGIVFFQNVQYMTAKFNDPRWIWAIVILLFILDTSHSALMIYVEWVYSVQDYADIHAMFWPYALTFITTAFSAFLVQTFLAYRIYRIGKKRAGLIALAMFSLSNLILGIIFGSFGLSYTTPDQSKPLRHLGRLWMVLEATINVIISGMLIFILLRSRNIFHKSNTAIDRLVRAFIQTGLFTGIYSVLSMVIYTYFPLSHFYAILSIPMGRAYSITMMDTLLVRHAMKDIVTAPKPSTSAIWELRDMSFGIPTSSDKEAHVRKEVWTDRCGSLLGQGVPQHSHSRSLCSPVHLNRANNVADEPPDSALDQDVVKEQRLHSLGNFYGDGSSTSGSPGGSSCEIDSVIRQDSVKEDVLGLGQSYSGSGSSSRKSSHFEPIMFTRSASS